MKKYLFVSRFVPISMRLLVCSICLTCALVTGCGSGGSAAVDESAVIDLTVLSTTMLYAEINNILTNPENYTGKTIKMSGPYYAFYDAGTNRTVHYVAVEEADGCCMRGLEFVLGDGFTYPDDYPGEPARIEVNGIFKSYQKEVATYYYLAVDDIVILE